MIPNITDLTPDALNRYIETHREPDYQLVDVRQPGEYTGAHIPGANLLPLPELEKKLSDLPGDRDLIFYCHSGARSRAAATLAADGQVTAGQVYNLVGGISAWEGNILIDAPRLAVFEGATTPADTLRLAMDLEKGALRFYAHLSEALEDSPVAETVGRLGQAERAHARTVYGFWKDLVEAPEDFESLFEALPGEILEGGTRLAEALGDIGGGRQSCVRYLEMALEIELTAFDLYRTMADRSDDAGERDAFFTLAQAEKAHMRTIIAAIPRCP
jgi:sulfur-carrier protein adenylyltransferase/sulfurtransferase